MTTTNPLGNISSTTWSSAHTFAENAANNASMSGIGIAMTIFSIIGTILIGLSVLPQTIKTIRDHQTQQINVLMYIFLVVGCTGLGIYGIGLVVVGNHIVTNYLTQSNLSYMINSTTFEPITTTVGGTVGAFVGNPADYISPGQFHNFGVDYIVPGAMLIFGEFFAAITSAIVLYYKVANKMVSKKHNTTEDEICKAFAKNHPSRLLPVFHHHTHHTGGNK